MSKTKDCSTVIISNNLATVVVLLLLEVFRHEPNILHNLATVASLPNKRMGVTLLKATGVILLKAMVGIHLKVMEDTHHNKHKEVDLVVEQVTWHWELVVVY